MFDKILHNKDNLQRGLAFAYRVGDYFENKVGQAIVNTPLGVDELGDDFSFNTWYRVPIDGCMTGDGSLYYIFVKKGRSDNLLVFFSGGGVAWNEYTAARPSGGGRITAGLPNYYWDNLRPFTQIMNIRVGITEDNNPKNLFKDYSQVIITYATGDFHVGNNDYSYKDENGNEKILHFHGYENFRRAMEVSKKFFPSPKKLLIAGDSAGAFAVSALSGIVYEDYYKECDDITLLADSGQLLYDKWHDTAKNIWKCDKDIYDVIYTDNITADWFEALFGRYKNKFKYLYASSTHDYLLSAYYNDVANKVYGSDSDVQNEYYLQLCDMIDRLHKINPDFAFYINDFRNMMVMKGGMHGGTTHTNVRSMNFHRGNVDMISMERWLYDATCGNVYSSGLELLDKRSK